MRSAKNVLGTTGRVAILAIFLLMVILPLYWVVITSFKTKTDIVSLDIQYFPTNPTTENYEMLWKNSNFPTAMKNSLICGLASGFIVLIISIFGGYALARREFRGKQITVLAFLATQMIPGLLLMIPLYIIFGWLKLVDNLMGLIIFYVIINMPFCLITMRSFFERIPLSLEEAAMVDGCTKMSALFKVVLPIMFPGIVAVFVFAFTGAWNDILGGVMFIHSEELKTIPVALHSFVGKFNIEWGQMMAGATISLIPTVILFAVVQKYIVSGLTAGAVKE